MRARFSVLSVLLVICGFSASAQDARWQAHTSMREITDLSASSDAIWAATTGGVFRYVVDSGEMSAYTASDGLHNLQTQAIAYDAVRDVVWIGYGDGVLDRLDPETGVVNTFRDIERAERFASREINQIVVRGDSLFLSTSFGVVVFDPERTEVRDTYSQLGSLAAGTPVHDLAFVPGEGGGTDLWLATNGGVAYASLRTENLQDPASWTVETVGASPEETLSIEWFDGSLYVGTDGGILRRDGAESYSSLGVSGRAVSDLYALEDRLLAVDVFDVNVVRADGSGRRVEIEGYQDPVAAIEGPDGLVWVGDRQGGLIGIERPDVTTSDATIVAADVYPRGPYTNLFSELDITPGGTLWGIGTGDQASAFYRFAPPDDWTNYIRRNFPEIGAGYERIYVDETGQAWAGASGPGLAQVTPDGEVHMWNHLNSSLRPASSTTDYVIIGGIATDDEGRVWVTNRGSNVLLHVYESDGGWTGLPEFECTGFSPSGLTLDKIVIDSFGQKWIVVLDLANLRRVVGLLVLETSGTPTDPGDDYCNFFASEGSGGQGLPGTTVTAVVEDRDGLIWIGTDRGLAFMINSGIVARDDNATPIWPQFADRTQGTFLLNGVKINDLAVDPANRLWVATDDGVSVVEQVEGGYELSERFTSRNSPLFSDVVVALAVDRSTGRVYMATDQGLVSYESDAVAASEQPRDLKVYPNPAHLAREGEASIYIEGLVEETELRVLTLAGEVVARMQTRGGRARWDGRGLDDELVPSGVYLVVAVGSDGEGTAHGKVAVIR